MEIWLKIFLSKLFQFACFQDVLVKACEPQIFTQSKPRLHSADGFPGAKRSPKKLTHRVPAPQKFSGGKNFVILALVLWNFYVLWFDIKALKISGILAAQCLSSSSGGMKILIPFLLSGLQRDLVDGLFFWEQGLQTPYIVWVTPGSRENRSEVKSAFCSPAPSVPHAASSPSPSSKQGLSEFPTVASETSLCWLPAQL